jgi:ferredoxin-type protein NapH
MSEEKNNVDKRKRTQLIMWWFLPVIIIGGIFWPYLGFLVLAMMLFFLVLSAFKGRYWCGWLCPRGSFLERVFAPLSPGRKIPRLFKNTSLRWGLLTVLVGFMVFRLIMSGGVLAKIAFVFVTMCIITTVLAILLGLAFKPRTWCAICPMGTLQGVIGRRRNLLKISPDCTECGTCGKVCPIGTAPSSMIREGAVSSLDCLRCPECTARCPKSALAFPESEASVAAVSGKAA